MEHLKKNYLNLEGQHGFLQRRSTLTALVELVEDVVNRLEKGESIVSTYLDLSKAFDCLSHDIVLSKLKVLGFRDTALNWFESYLRDREQLVELRQNINGACTTIRSESCPISRGVPQGSVLGPVIFILFTHDFPAYTEEFSKTVMYADDSVLISSSTNVEDLEVKSFISLSLAAEYCSMNDLVFNEGKSRQLCMGRMKDEISHFSNIQSVDSIKHLGLNLDSKLKWEEHIDGLCKKLSSGIFALRRIKAISTVEAVKTAYHALIDSHIRYGIVLWGASCQQNLNRVLLLQKRAVRVMADLDWMESCRGAFVKWKIQTVVNTYILEVITFACSLSPQRNEDVHHHNTRRAHDFNLPAHHTRRFERKPSYSGTKLFNLLPEEIKCSRSEKLKHALNHWLLQHPFYSVDEYLNWRTTQT